MKTGKHMMVKKLVSTMTSSLVISVILVPAIILCLNINSFAQTQTSHTVISGDTLWLISQKYNTTVNQIMTANNLSTTNLYVGQVLKIPQLNNSPTVKHIDYQVRQGDTLGSLAEYFGTTVTQIKSLNGLNNEILSAGTILKIPVQYVNYKVNTGDTLYDISVKFNTSVSKIMLFNRLTDYTIFTGQVLHIPYVTQVPRKSFITHTVTAGDTIWSVSIQYGIPMQEVISVNGLTANSYLSIGQKISIPVYNIPVKPTPGPQYGEYLDWWTEAQYLFPIGKKATITDFITKKSYTIERTIGASHADCEPLTSGDAATMKEIWGGYTWATRSIIVEIDGRRIAASASSMPHGIEYIKDNSFDGHFDIHFKNSRRHKDDRIDEAHQAKIRIAAGVNLP
ncbi:MAG: LysM peptidoglycan-binding domain-containing protein [Clostridia bacterium]|nr:LysM peptidoglycan-binding domain-containing protein [Clostridia bacterium]